MQRILVIGALGQVGRELVERLNQTYGAENVFPTDIKVENAFPQQVHQLDVTDRERMRHLIQEFNIDTVYNMAALLSATAEQKPVMAWKVNMEGLLNSLELAKEGHFEKLFWPSSIAVFGPTTPRINTAQHTIAEPSTVYGISKLAGERWCEYYAKKHNVDVRSLRYPGLIGYKSMPGGGTTDYAVDIFHKAIKNQPYECFLEADTSLPMMYMPDAIDATVQIMQAPKEDIHIRSSYNISAFSFTPEELAFEITREIPDFEVSYHPDFRQALANSWPSSIDDKFARNDWNWNPKFDLQGMVKDMLKNLQLEA